ncbi:protein tyrosine phosphatase [Albimonas donghaensis]|uniref:Protein tyrosine phosphatase n=1 Tax=Albimonas donghaensis TaxID=356660 RepID=A0A1H2QY25_9RHOB|nr:low molecular weight phosphatase family protein [Albimonas donghaensis]SDW11838.1 protein tyrosine phosphatase [Albimonas donghaensis]
MALLPASVLFCCDHNAVRSPMAEGLMKKLHGTRIFVQSAGVKHDMEVDPFAVAVCAEIGVELEKHRARSFEDLATGGEQIDSYELIVALSPAAQRAALDHTRWYATEVRYWPTLDPTGIGERREQKLDAYRATRDQILANLRKEFSTF